MVPSGEVLNSEQLVKVCEINISGHKLCVDLITLEMHDYDVILSMDRLSKHYNFSTTTKAIIYTQKRMQRQKNVCHLCLKSS